MADLLSPGTNIQETDLTTGTVAVSTSIGGFAGNFTWGPTNQITQVSNEPQVVSLFGKPNNTTYASFFSATNFLQYANTLKLARIATAGQLNAVASGTPINIGNSDVYNTEYSSGQASVGMFAAMYPGTLGNTLQVSMADASTYNQELSGTISVTTGSNILAGTSTSFESQLVVGSYVSLTIAGTTVTYQVTAITSDTSATVSTAYTSTVSGLVGTAKWQYASLFTGAPVDSNQAVAVGATGDGLHMVVVDVLGLFTGTANTVLETYSNVSKASNALSYDGSSGYYKTVLNTSSSYIYWMGQPTSAQVGSIGISFGQPVSAGTFVSLNAPITVQLSGGSDGAAATDGETMIAYDLFSSTEHVSVSLFFTGQVSAAVSQYAIQDIAQYRQDCVAFVSPNNAGAPIIGNTPASLQAILSWYNALNVDSSYGVADTGFKYQYDKYNDVYRWIPLNADIAGLCAYTDSVAQTWYSPAGLTRGQIKNVTRLAYNPNKSDRDTLFSNNINPVVTFPGQGTVLWGDKTTLARPSAFGEIGVRRLFIYLEQTMLATSKSFLFEQNTVITQSLFQATITPLLRNVKGQQGITDFLVDMGTSVNTPDTMDGGELNANIFIKPVHSVRFINLNFIATRTGASFTELQG